MTFTSKNPIILALHGKNRNCFQLYFSYLFYKIDIKLASTACRNRKLKLKRFQQQTGHFSLTLETFSLKTFLFFLFNVLKNQSFVNRYFTRKNPDFDITLYILYNVQRHIFCCTLCPYCTTVGFIQKVRTFKYRCILCSKQQYIIQFNFS